MKAIVIIRANKTGVVSPWQQACLIDSADISALTGAGMPLRILVPAIPGAAVGTTHKVEVAVSDHSPASPAIRKGQAMPDGTTAGEDQPARDAVCWGVLIPQ